MCASTSGTSSSVGIPTAALGRLGRSGLDSHLLEREALAHGLYTWRLSATAFLAGPSTDRIGTLGFNYTASTLTSKVAREIAGDRQRSRVLLKEWGVPVPEGRAFSFRQLKPARRYARSLGYPVVAKPAAGRSGTGLATGLADEASVVGSIERLQRGRNVTDRFVIETHRPGNSYRILVIDDEAASAIRRDPPQVIGDGQRTIATLIEHANRTWSTNPYLRARPLELDERALRHVSTAGWSPDAVPGDGVPVTLASCAVTRGAINTIDVTDEVHPDILDLAVRAARALPGLGHAGVDVLAEDHRRPTTRQEVSVLGIDASPPLGMHEFPGDGQGRRVSELLFRRHVNGSVGRRLPDEPMTMRMTLVGTSAPQRYKARVAQLAEELGATMISAQDHAWELSATISGHLDAVSVVPALIGGRSRADAPSLVQSVRVSGNQGGDAEVRG